MVQGMVLGVALDMVQELMVVEEVVVAAAEEEEVEVALD